MVRHVWDLGKLVLVGKLCDTSQHSPPSYRRVKLKAFWFSLVEPLIVRSSLFSVCWLQGYLWVDQKTKFHLPNTKGPKLSQTFWHSLTLTLNSSEHYSLIN